MPSQKKIKLVEEIKNNLLKSKAVVLTDHTGLTHQQIEKLRNGIKKGGGNFMVVKNTLLRKALEKTSFADKVSDEVLKGQTSLVLAVSDEITPLKELFRTFSELGLPKIKKGALLDRILEKEDILRLAQLPEKKVILGQVLGMLKSPSRVLVFTLKGNLIKLVLLLKALSEKKQTEKN